MAIWAIADLHLSLGVPSKTMEIFGPQWSRYIERMRDHWVHYVQQDDLVLIAGDISWAMRLEEALPDLQWIESLPGTKAMIRGNHDYWWSSPTKVRSILPPSLHIIQHDAWEWQGYSIGGTRLWDTEEYHYSTPCTPDPEREKIYARELLRLEMSLKAMSSAHKLVMTHYPPLGTDLKPSRVSKLLTQYGVTDCVFGHMHGLDAAQNYFGTCEGVRYHLTASDYLSFVPKRIL